MNPIITVAAAIILNEKKQILLVRKKNTESFMHIGGKLDAGETPEQALNREVFEETGCHLNLIAYLGQYETATANEKDHILVSHLYHIELLGTPKIQAEIAEMKWLDLDDDNAKLAPLTKDISIPWCKAQLKR